MIFCSERMNSFMDTEEKVTNVDGDNATIMTQQEFDSFVKSSVTAYLGAHNLEKITVEDGQGRKGVVKINKNGEYVVQVTTKEIL